MHILIIEDNADILANLYGYLESLGYTVDCARNGFAGLSQSVEMKYDAIVLDVMLPGMDGLEVCRQLRNELNLSTPVLMLTARDTLEDKIAGFDHGADDYLVKPFSLIELDARLKALVRRANDTQTIEIAKFGPLTFNPATFEAFRESIPILLTPTGYKVLALLMREAPNVVSKEQIERKIWGDIPPDSDALRTHIHSLRQALDKPFAFPMLKTIKTVGYRLVDPDAH